MGAFALGLAVSAAFAAWLASISVVTLLYTFLLKRKILVDALALAALYTLRILAGGAAADMWPGFWLLAFSLFLFLSLAFVKRYSELEVVLRQGRHGTHGRDYLVVRPAAGRDVRHRLGLRGGLVMALYINGDSIARLYPHQAIVWLTVPILLYWISRMWVKAHRGEMHDDPVVFAMTDGLSRCPSQPSSASCCSPGCPVMRPVSSWGRCRATCTTWSTSMRRQRRQRIAGVAKPGLPFGNGRSYGDVCLNAGGILWATRGLDRFLAFDERTGVIECEAGVTLKEVIDLCPAARLVPRRHPWHAVRDGRRRDRQRRARQEPSSQRHASATTSSR